MDELIIRIIDLAARIQQVGAPTFREAERADLVQQLFMEAGLDPVERDETGNVYARLTSRTGGRPLVVSAHLDTVFPPEVELRCVREAECITAPGIGDNALGIAALFGLAWMLRRNGTSLPGDLWLVTNTCEEGLGNLRGMRALVDRFETAPSCSGNTQSPIAYIVLEGMSLGGIYHRALGVERYRLSVETEGGHSWLDYGKPSAIHELATLATRITSMNVPTSPRSSLNIGVMRGGSSVNTIAAEAMLELDLRSESPASLAELARQVVRLAGEARKPGVEVKCEHIGHRPAGDIPEDHPLVRLAQECLQAQGIQPVLRIGSTDANLPLSRGLPAVTICLTTGGKAHTVNEYIDLPPLEKGMQQLVCLVRRAWEVMGEV